MRTLICGRGPLKGIPLLGRRPAASVPAAGASSGSQGLPVHDSELGQRSNPGKSSDATPVDQDSRTPLRRVKLQAATATDASLEDLDAVGLGEILVAAQGLTGPRFDPVPASVRVPLLTSQNAGATSSAGRKRKRQAA